MLKSRVPVEVVRPRITRQAAVGSRQHYPPGPVRNYAVGGRDLLAELNTWVASLPDRSYQLLEDEPEPKARPAPPIRAVMPPHTTGSSASNQNLVLHAPSASLTTYALFDKSFCYSLYFANRIGSD